MYVDVVDKVPVAVGGGGGEAVGIDGRVLGPGMDLFQREVAIDDADLVLVTIQDRGEQLRVHLGAVGAFEVVEADDEHGRVGWTATRGTARRGPFVLGI